MAKIEWPHRDDPCPERLPGLSHIQSGSPECVFCGVMTTGRADAPARTKTAAKPKRTNKRKAPTFTKRQIKQLEFLKYLRDTGRL